MSNKSNHLNEEIGEAIKEGLRTFKESTAAAKTVDPSGYDDPALYQDTSGRGVQLGTLETPHDAAQNMATIQAKPSDATGAAAAPSKKKKKGKEEQMQEELSTADYLNQLFDGEDLSEDFMEKIATIFEAALTDRISFIEASMQESFNNALNEQVETLSEELSEKLDEFLSYVVEEWTRDNEVAIERGIKADIAESFLTGLKELFESHYIEMPDEKVKVVEELYDIKESLEAQLNEQLERNIELSRALDQTTAQSVFVSMCEGLTDTEIERFGNLAETVVYEDYDQYTRKLGIIRESFVGRSPQMIEEDSDYSVQDLNENVSHNAGTDPIMEAYTKAIGFQNRNKK